VPQTTPLASDLYKYKINNKSQVLVYSLITILID